MNKPKFMGVFMPIMFDAGTKSEGGAAEAETDELKAIKAISDQVDAFNSMLGEKANAADIASIKSDLAELKDGLDTMSSKNMLALMDKINEKNASLQKQIIELQEKEAEEKESNTPNTAKRKELVSKAAIEAFVKSVWPDGKEGEKSTSKENGEFIEIKAAETFGYPQTFPAGTDITAFTGRYVDPTLYQRRRKKNLILDYFNIQTINVPTLVYLRKLEVGDANPVAGDPGGAAWILCGDPKPKRSFRVTTGTVEAKKLAIFGTIEDCLLQDIPSFERWIREDFMDEMREAYNDGLLNNNPAVNALAPLGLKTNAIQYTPTPAYTNTIVDPTYIDMIIAAIALFAFNKENAGFAFVSSDVFYRIHHLKSTDARYLNNSLVYTNSVGQLFIAGVEVVPVDEEDVPSTHLLMIGADLGFKIYNYGEIRFERGLNGEDFREDKTSYRAWQRVLSFIAEDRENSVLYDTWANIQAAIEAAPVV